MRKLVLSLLSAASLFAQDGVQGISHGWIDQAPALIPLPDNSGNSSVRIRQVSPIVEQDLRFHHSEDGKAVLILRVNAGGAPALRLHFDEMHLPEGAGLVLYSYNRESGRTHVVGSFEKTGPNPNGEFWTRPVAGPEAILELRLEEEVANLPFRIGQVELLAGIEESASEANPARQIERRVSNFRGMRVEHEVVDGLAIWDGDMILGRAEELEPFDKNSARSAAANSYKWPGGIVPYVLDPALTDQWRFTAAIDHWNSKLAGNIRLVPWTTESNYVRFSSLGDYTCASYIGNTGLVPQPVYIGSACSVGNIIHEIGHTFGLYHEHTRSDRDSYVDVLTDNIQANTSYNFSKVYSTNLTAYDYGSIMHYGAYAYSANGLPTIVTKPAGISIGQRDGLSAGDIAGIKVQYPSATASITSPTISTAPPPPPPPTTVSTVSITLATNPAGVALVVDGASVATPAVLQWSPGSSHTIAATGSTTATTRYSFLSWSDGGAATHTISTPATAASYTATFSAAYKVSTVINSGVGFYSNWPASADGFYPANSGVGVNVLAGSGYCFNSWTGILPISRPSVWLTVSGPMTVGANMQAGTITASPTYVAMASAGGTTYLNVTATPGCSYNVERWTGWITIQSATSATGSTTVTVKVDPNTTGQARTGYVAIGNSIVTVQQQ